MLPEDHIGDFDAMIDFVIKGSVDDALSTEKWGEETIERCVSFLVYAKKYGLGRVDDLVYGSLKKAVTGKDSRGLRGDHIERVFDLTSEASSLRVLITQAALSLGGGLKGGSYRKQEKGVPGFAAEYLDQLRMASSYISWKDPLQKEDRDRDMYLNEYGSEDRMSPMLAHFQG